MRVYVAGSAVEQEKCRELAGRLTAAGHEVTSRWLSMDVGQGANLHQSQQEVMDAARADLEDVAIAHAIVMLVPHPLAGPKAHSGGRHVEVGFAIALGKLTIILGQPENIFERCAHVCATVEEVLRKLK